MWNKQHYNLEVGSTPFGKVTAHCWQISQKIWQCSWISHPGHLPPNQLCQALAVWNHEIRCDGDWVSRPFIFHVHNVATCIGFRFSGKTVIGIDALLWVKLPLGYSAIHFFCRVVEFWSRAMSIWNLSLGWYVVVFRLNFSGMTCKSFRHLRIPIMTGFGFPPHMLAKSTTSAVKAPFSHESCGKPNSRPAVFAWF